MMRAIEDLKAGQDLLDARNVPHAVRQQAAWHTYPASDLSADSALLVAASEAHFWHTTPQPHTVEAVAQHVCRESGVFPWEGPVGNGLTVAEYQIYLRHIATAHIDMWQRLGLDTAEGPRHE